MQEIHHYAASHGKWYDHFRKVYFIIEVETEILK